MTTAPFLVEETRRALRAPEAATWLNERLHPTVPFTPRMLWRLSRQNQIPTFRVAKQYWYLTDLLEAWIRASGGTASSTRWAEGDDDDSRRGAR